jgi:arylformamidase
MKIYDITATIGGNLPVYHEGERPEITQTMYLEKGDMCNFSRFSATMHTGTHADVPLHFIDGGAACDNVSLMYFYGTAKVFRLAVTSHVSAKDLQTLDIRAGDIVLLDLGQSALMRRPEMDKDYLALTPDAASYLADKGIKTVGIDYLSVDPADTEDFAVHKILLGNGVAIVEGLVLEGVPEGEYILSALPLKFENGNGSPVRAVLVRH